MGLRDTVIRVKGKANDVRRRLMMPEGARCFLIKRAGDTQRFTSVLELTAGWAVEYNDWRQQIKVEIADGSNQFIDTMAQTTHIAYGVPSGGIIDVYTIDPEKRDVVPPTAANPLWKVYVTRDPVERYTLP